MRGLIRVGTGWWQREWQTHHHRYGLTSGLVQLLNWGVLYYSFGILLPAMHETTGLGMALLSAMPTIAALAGAVTAPLLGRLWGRVDPQRLMLAGMVLGGLTLLLWALAEQGWQFLAVAVLLGVSQVLCFYDAAFLLVRRQIQPPSRRPPVLKRITLLGGLASTVLVPITAAVAGLLSWRLALVVLAAILLLVSLPLTIRLKSVYTADATEADPPERTDAWATPIAAWVLRVWSFGVSLASAATATILPASLLSRGYPEGITVTLVALLGAMQLAGRLLVTPLEQLLGLDRLLRLTPLAICASLAALAWLPLSLAWLGVLLGGAAFGMSALIRPLALERATSQLEVFTRLNGQLAGIGLLARACGPVTAGLVLESTQTGGASLGVIAVIALLTSLVIGGHEVLPTKAGRTSAHPCC